MTQTNAWLMECDTSLSIAVAEHEIVEYVQHPISKPTKNAEYAGSKEMELRGESVPIVDFSHFSGMPIDTDPKAVCVVVYQLFPGDQLKQLAISIASAPRKIVVDDSQACDLPEEMKSSQLAASVLSCFSVDDKKVLILDFANFCKNELNQTVTKN